MHKDHEITISATQTNKKTHEEMTIWTNAPDLIRKFTHNV